MNSLHSRQRAILFVNSVLKLFVLSKSTNPCSSLNAFSTILKLIVQFAGIEITDCCIIIILIGRTTIYWTMNVSHVTWWYHLSGIIRTELVVVLCLPVIACTAAVRSVPQLIAVFHNNNHVFFIDGLVAVLRYPFSSARLPLPPSPTSLVFQCCYVATRHSPPSRSRIDTWRYGSRCASTQTHVALLVSSIITYFPLVAGRISLLVGKECQQG